MSSDTKMERKKNTQYNQALPITGIFCLQKALPVVKFLSMNVCLK